MESHWSKQRIISQLISQNGYDIKDFIQIGGNDGIQDDFMRDMIIHNKWKTHILEPVDVYFEMLKQNYSAYPHVLCCPYAILEESGKTKIHFVPPLENHDWVQGCSTFYPTKNCVGTPYPLVAEVAQTHIAKNTTLKEVDALS